MNARCDVAIIGAGITGLVAARSLHRRGLAVRVIERSDRPGGIVRSERRDDLVLEHGPYSVMLRSEGFRNLIDSLGLRALEASADGTSRRYIQHRGRLREAPTSIPGLLRTSLLTPFGKARLAWGVVRSRPRPGDEDTTLDEFAARRLGREAADRLVAAGAVGVFAAESHELGFDGCLPRLAAGDRTARSARGVMHSGRTPGAPPRSLVSFPGGLQELTDALAAELQGNLRLGTAVRSIFREPGGFRVRFDDGSILADRVVLATPAPVTGHLLTDLAPEASIRLGEIDRAGLAVVHLLLDRDSVEHDLRGFGYLVPPGEAGAEPVLGMIWPSGVFPEHVPEDRVVLRLMVGGTRWPDAIELDDDALVARCVDAVAPVVGIHGPVTDRVIHRWPNSVPIYRPGHAERCREILHHASHLPGLDLVGGWIGGLGINDRVQQGLDVADRIANARSSGTPRRDDSLEKGLVA